MKKRLLITMLVSLTLLIPLSSGQERLCDLPSNAPKPESCEVDLKYDLLDTEIREETVNQDIFIPRVKIDTNAENLYLKIGDSKEKLYNDGNHQDYSSTDRWYGNSLDISDTIGEKQIKLNIKKESESKTINLQETEFKKTPPKPEIDAEFNDQGLLLEIVDISYPKETQVNLNVSVTNGEENKKEEELSLKCMSSCVRQVSFNSEAGDEAEVEARQIYGNFKSNKKTKKFKFAGEPSISTIKYSRGVRSDLNEKISIDSYWMPGTIGLSGINFDKDDIQEINYTYEGKIVGNWDQKPSVAFDLYKELDSYAGNIILLGNYNVSGSEIPGSIGSQAGVDLNIRLESGETLSRELTTLEIVEDNQAPYISEDPTVWHINSSSVDISLNMKDNLQNHLNCEAYTSDKQKFIGDCSTNTRSPDGEFYATLETDMPKNIGNVINIDIELDDGSGNSETETLGPFIIDTSGILDKVEKNGDPREKINLIVIGHKMNKDTTEKALNERIEWFMNEKDMSLHSKYRDFFNWYIIDTKKQLCAEDIGGLEEQGEECPFLEYSGETIVQSDEIRGGRVGIIVMSSQNFRSYAGSAPSGSIPGKTMIANQEPGGDQAVFAHELGHLVWGFDDEYDGGNSIVGSGRSYSFFPYEDESKNYNIEKYPNTFPMEENCESNMSIYYSDLRPSDCWYQDAQKPGWIVRAGKGDSLMNSNKPTYYENHRKRIKYLVENSPIYEGVIN